MALQEGTRLGAYEVISPLGAGGMGEVYRARDTKLQRDVALKVLPETMARDAQRMARFEREARTLASLNHPNIAAIYGLEESNGVRALVMELVEGETLAERLRRTQSLTRPASRDTLSPQAGRGEKLNDSTPSPQGRGWSGGAGPGEGSRGSRLATDDALPIAKQIAEALEYAHERGVVHRDLKPANAKITPEGTVKVLDFGLAKVLTGQDSSVTMDPANSPTLSTMATQAGVILGTAAYMSPEQAKGQRVDRRADIWAFGCVLYEMLTGRKPFEGETISDMLAAVIRADPDWAAIPEATPQAIKKLVYRCLQKDQHQRLQAIGEARITIEEAISGVGAGLETRPYEQSEPVAAPLRRVLPWALAVATIAAVVFGAVALHFMLQPKPQQSLMRFTVPPPKNAQFGGMGPSISPDGRTLAFVAKPAPDEPAVLWLRSLGSLTATQIPGTEGAGLSFWSPDGQYIAFFAGGKLEKVAVSGGAPQTICDVRGGFGGTWNRDGVILLSNAGVLYRVPATGGTPALVLTPDEKSVGYFLPQFLPDGKHFLFLFMKNLVGASINVGVGTLDSKKTVSLFKGSSNAVYARPGYLVYVQGGNLMARGFNAKSLKFTGQAVPVAGNVQVNAFQSASFSVSQSGVLAYRTGGAGALDEMTWFNRKGRRLGVLGQPGIYAEPAVSPDGTRLAVSSISPDGKTADIWIYNLKRGTRSRLTFTPALNDTPRWSNDGSSVYFSSNRDGNAGIYRKQADGLGKTQQIFQPSSQNAYLNTLSPKDRYAIFLSPSSTSPEWVLPLTGDRKPSVYIQGAFDAALSPNGRYVAYASTASGIYVQTFPQHLGKWQISTGGGLDFEPAWRSDGKELFYRAANDEMMSVDVTTDSDKFQAGTPRPLFKQKVVSQAWRNSFAVTPDGQRFLMMAPVSEANPSPITVVVNWTALLKKQ